MNAFLDEMGGLLDGHGKGNLVDGIGGEDGREDVAGAGTGGADLLGAEEVSDWLRTGFVQTEVAQKITLRDAGDDHSGNTESGDLVCEFV